MLERNIDIVLSDIDGTQIRPDANGIPSPAVSAAAHRLRHNDISLLEVTARSHGLLSQLVEPLDLRDNLCTLDGGATVAHADSGDIVWSQWLSVESKRNILAAIGAMCVRISFDRESWALQPHEVLPALEDGRFQPISSPAIFSVFSLERSNDITEALAEVPNILHTPVMKYDKNPTLGCIQVNDQGVDKHSGIKKMLLHANLTHHRTLAIGDGTNDLPLFAAAGSDGIKVAMGNACEELKDLADWVAPPVGEDGFAATMGHFGLI